MIDAKLKKMSSRYADQDDDERELRLRLLGSKGKAPFGEATPSSLAPGAASRTSRVCSPSFGAGAKGRRDVFSSR